MEVDYRRAISANALLNLVDGGQCNAVRCSKPLSLEQVQRLAEGLAETKVLKALDIRGSRLDETSMIALASGLRGNTTLELLDVGETDGGLEGLSALCSALKAGPKLVELGLRRSGIDDELFAVVVDFIQASPSLQVIYLGGNSIGDEGARLLAEVLKTNDVLREVYLAKNRINDDGVEALAEMLFENFTLKKLALSNNLFKSRGMKAMFTALAKHPSIEHADLRGQMFSNLDVPQLLELLEMSPGMRILVNMSGLTPKNRQMIQALAGSSGKGNKTEAKFRSTLLRNEKGPWQRSRLMIVGEGRAGKTATVRSLLGISFNPNLISTVGIALTESKTEESGYLKRVKGKSKGYALHLAHRIAVGEYSSKEPKDETETTDENSAKRRRPGSLQVNRSSATQTQQKSSIVGSTKPSSQTLPRGNDDKSKESLAPTSEGERTSVVRKEVKPVNEYKYDEKLSADVAKEKDSVSISIWDFGGQRVFQTLHHLFLTRYGVYLLVFSMREAQKDFEKCRGYMHYWLSSISVFASTAPIIVAGSFFDQALGDSSTVVKELNSKISSAFEEELLKQVVRNGKEGWFWPISNATGYGMSRLRESVKRTVESQKHVYHRVSIKWMWCLDKLTAKRNEHANRSRPYFSLSEFKELAESVGIRSVVEVEKMLKLFHQFGLLLYFSATETLRTQIITQPQWLIDEISKVIRDKDLHSFDEETLRLKGLYSDLKTYVNRGIATHDLLQHFFGKKQTDYLIDLMHHLLLLSNYSFKGGSDESRYIIPSMIVDSPESAEEELLAVESGGLKAAAEAEIVFRLLPNGMFQRLVCLLVAYSSTSGAHEPVLASNYAKLKLADDNEFTLRCSAVEQSISMIFMNKEKASQGVMIIVRTLQKVKEDFGGDGFEWAVFAKVSRGGKEIFEPFDKAVSAGMPPWAGKAEEGKFALNFASFLKMV